MDEMRPAIVRMNIARYEGMLRTETDPDKLRVVQGLLEEARNEVRLLMEEAAAEKAAREDAKRLRMQAEEYRTIADATKSQTARGTYLNLARTHELMAERAEAKMRKDVAQWDTKTGCS